MKRKLLLFLLLIFFGFFVNFSFAQEKSGIIYPPPPETTPNFLGQSHYYTVTFRGNGEAVVNLKVVLSTLADKPLSTVSLRVPRVEPKDIVVYQVIREKQCISWLEYPTRCQQYQEPDYYQPWWGQQKYQKAKYEMGADTLIVNLPTPIEKDKSGSFIVYYRALGYAKKNLFGAFNFVFETAKVEERVQNLQVGITTDSDLYLKGTKGKVIYRFDQGEVALKAVPPTGEFTNVQFDNFYQQIGQGSVIKTATNLQPLESYTVKGSYADSFLKLYGKEIVIGLGVVFLFFLILFLVGKAVLLKMKKSAEKEKEGNWLWALSVAGLSFLSAILIFGYSLFVFWLIEYFNFYYSQSTPLLMILIFLISVSIYLAFVFIPAIFIGIKKGFSWGLVTFVLTVFWLIFFSVITFFVLFFSGKIYPPVPVYPQPMMEKSVKKSD